MEQPLNSTTAVRSAILVFYEPDTGEIVHGHYCEVPADAEMPGREALEKQALEHAQRHARKDRPFDPGKLAILHVDPRDFRMDRLYRVNRQKQKLVEIAAGRQDRDEKQKK